MTTDEHQGVAEPQKVYRVELGMRILLYAFAGFMIVVGIAIGVLELAGVDTNGRRSDMGPIGNGLIVLVFVGMGLMIVLAGRSTKLIMTSEGVEYRTLGYRLTARWENIRAIGPVGRGNHKPEGLLLRDPPDRTIPLVGFGSPRYGPLSRDLKQHAPHLFNEDGRPKDSS